MKILLTGAKGQLGQDLTKRLAADGYQVNALAREGLDLTDTQQIRKVVKANQADWVVNCAAYTQVDKAESEPELAHTANAEAPGELAKAVAQYGGRLLHVSTDFVFDGRQGRPYTELDEPVPLSVYGESKHEGERRVREQLPDALIVRTAWVYGINGHNFVNTILKACQARDELQVVDDQIGSPSWTVDISRAIAVLMAREAKGCFHFSNSGVASWYDFAEAIVEEAVAIGYPVRTDTVTPIPTQAWPTDAVRPHNSVLAKDKIRPWLDWPIPHWRESLREALGAGGRLEK